MLRILTFALFISPFIASTVHADEREAFYGKWGTEKQCKRAPIKPGGTVLSEPFEISEQWLKQGRLWCSLSWFPVAPREDGYFTGAQAQCGEDSVRGYRLGLVLSNEELTIRWDFPTKNGPLTRCEPSNG